VLVDRVIIEKNDFRARVVLVLLMLSSMRTKGMRALALISVVVGGTLVACGQNVPLDSQLTPGPGGAASTSAAGAGGVAGSTSGAGSSTGGIARAAVGSTKAGVPVGDCPDPTPDELAAAGCPTTEPIPESSCDVVDRVCRYPIKSDGSSATQDVFVCWPGYPPQPPLTWGPGGRVVCGQSCGEVAPGAIVFDVGDCKKRPLTACLDATQPASPFDTNQSTLDGLLGAVVAACGDPAYNNLLTLHVANGCPSSFSTEKPLASDVAACVAKRLRSLRWDCAIGLVCATQDFILD
jgi:hypothetical protein